MSRMAIWSSDRSVSMPVSPVAREETALARRRKAAVAFGSSHELPDPGRDGDEFTTLVGATVLAIHLPLLQILAGHRRGGGDGVANHDRADETDLVVAGRHIRLRRALIVAL